MVMRPSPTLHTDPDPGLRPATREGEAGELGSLVGVEDHRRAVRRGLVQALQAKGRLQGIRQPPREHFTAVLILDRNRENVVTYELLYHPTHQARFQSCKATPTPP